MSASDAIAQSEASCAVTVRPGGVAILDVHPNSKSAEELTLRLRNAADRSYVEVPLRRTEDGTGLTGAINAADLPQARWIAVSSVDGGRQMPVGYEPCDLRSVIRIDPASRTPFSHLLPYRNQNGFLSIRSWVRADHAECEHIELDESGEIVLSGRAVWAAGAGFVDRVYAQRRQGERVRVLGRVVASDESGGFRVALSVDELSRVRLTRRDNWDVYMTSTHGATARMAKLADDIPDRKSVYDFPRMGCIEPESEWTEQTPEPSISARPYLTADSGVSLLVVEEG